MAAIDDFVHALSTDDALLDRAKAAFSKEFASFASAEGYDVSASDVATYMDQHGIRLRHVMEGAYENS